MDVTTPDNLTAFHWNVQPAAGALVQSLLDQLLAFCPAAVRLRERMLAETGTRLSDWIDHVEVPDEPGMRERLIAAGFMHRPEPSAPRCYRHDGGFFPAILLTGDGSYALHMKTESVVEVLQAHDLSLPIAGAAWSPLRHVRLAEGHAELWAVERHGYRGFDILGISPERVTAILRHDEAFLTRRRAFENSSDGFAHARALVDVAVDELGADLACERFLRRSALIGNGVIERHVYSGHVRMRWVWVGRITIIIPIVLRVHIFRR